MGAAVCDPLSRCQGSYSTSGEESRTLTCSDGPLVKITQKGKGMWALCGQRPLHPFVRPSVLPSVFSASLFCLSICVCVCAYACVCVCVCVFVLSACCK